MREIKYFTVLSIILLLVGCSTNEEDELIERDQLFKDSLIANYSHKNLIIDSLYYSSEYQDLIDNDKYLLVFLHNWDFSFLDVIQNDSNYIITIEGMNFRNIYNLKVSNRIYKDMVAYFSTHSDDSYDDFIYLICEINSFNRKIVSLPELDVSGDADGVYSFYDIYNYVVFESNGNLIEFGVFHNTYN